MDAAGNVSGTATANIATAACPDTTPPSTPTGLATSAVGQTSATLSWTASTDNVAVTGYRVYRGGSQVATPTGTSFSFTGLNCATTYTLGVAAVDAAGNVSGTATTSVTTTACPDTTPPSTPTGLATSAVGQTSATLSWTASTDNVGVTGYRVYRGGSQVATSAGTSYVYSGLSCGQSYIFGVAAVDAASNVSSTASTTVTTSACPDTTPPSTPAGLSAGSVGQTSVPLSWNASTDNIGVTGYRLFQNGSQVGTTLSPSYIFGGLSCGTAYSLGVAAVDGAGNVSGTASTVVTTSTCGDTAAPSVPSGLAVSSLGQTSATFSWSASTDNVAVTGYRVFVNVSQIGSTAATSYGVTGLSCGTSYSFGVAAFDAAGNLSSQATISASTAACAGGGGGTANLFVASSGSDSTCSRSSSPLAFGSAGGHVCASFDKACHLASGGDTVIVEDGTYAAQDLGDCTGPSSIVTFRTEPGHECPYSALTPASQLPAQSSDTSCPVTINGSLDLQSSYRGAPAASPLKNLTFVGMYAKQLWSVYAHNITFSHMAATFFYIVSSDGITVDHGDFGNVFNGDCSVVAGRGPGTPDSSNVTIRGNIIHDSMRLTSAQGHPDGLFIQGLNGGVIDGNVFYRDAVLPLYLNSVAGGSIQNIVITNNVIHDVVDMTDTGSSTKSASKGNLAQQTLSLGDNSLTNVTVAFNSISGFIRRQDNTPGGSGTGPTSNLRVYGNVAYGMLWQSGQWGCGNNTSYDYNVWFGAEAALCGTHDSTDADPFTTDDSWSSQNQVTPGNYAVAAGTKPIGFVPVSWCSAHAGICPATDVTGAARPNAGHTPAVNAGAYENR